MTDKELHEKAVRLCEGGVEMVDGHFVKAIRVVEGFSVCTDCEMDCLCHDDMKLLCAECDVYENAPHYLRLANAK